MMGLFFSRKSSFIKFSKMFEKIREGRSKNWILLLKQFFFYEQIIKSLLNLFTDGLKWLPP